uniref:Uncharacterized protein n=1 Tax=Parascaris univalens TaxID=6257 RepID=A0A915BQB8_PARUN
FDEHQVKTFVYEKETNDLSSEFVRVKQPFTDPYERTVEQVELSDWNVQGKTSEKIATTARTHP